jgi:hypothetical protein
VTVSAAQREAIARAVAAEWDGHDGQWADWLDMADAVLGVVEAWLDEARQGEQERWVAVLDSLTAPDWPTRHAPRQKEPWKNGFRFALDEFRRMLVVVDGSEARGDD